MKKRQRKKNAKKYAKELNATMLKWIDTCLEYPSFIGTPPMIPLRKIGLHLIIDAKEDKE